MPNPLRALAHGAELYSVFLNIWADDVSGNVSKQYNKHNNLYVANMNIPSQLLSQEFFVHFFSTSPHASTAEQFSAIKAQVQYVWLSVATFRSSDSPSGKLTAILSPPSMLRQSNLANFVCSPLRFLRITRSSQTSAPAPQARRPATVASVRTAVGHRPRLTTLTLTGTSRTIVCVPNKHCLPLYALKQMQPGVPRHAAETRDHLEAQIRLACTKGITAVKNAQTQSGVKDRLTEHWIAQLLQQAKELKAKNKNLTQEQLVDQLRKWLDEQPGDKYNVLLDWLGAHRHIVTNL